MKESDTEGLATHGGPELCAAAREGDGEALAGDVQAGLLSREIENSGVPTLSFGRKATLRVGAIAKPPADPAVREPGHVRKLHAREPGCVTNVEGNLM
jgi:hypothetical protein